MFSVCHERADREAPFRRVADFALPVPDRSLRPAHDEGRRRRAFAGNGREPCEPCFAQGSPAIPENGAKRHVLAQDRSRGRTNSALRHKAPSAPRIRDALVCRRNEAQDGDPEAETCRQGRDRNRAGLRNESFPRSCRPLQIERSKGDRMTPTHDTFASGSTAQPAQGGASDIASRAVNSPPLAYFSAQPDSNFVRCSRCGQLTDGDCGGFRCPYSSSAACAGHGHGLRAETAGAREQTLSRREISAGLSRAGCSAAVKTPARRPSADHAENPRARRV